MRELAANPGHDLTALHHNTAWVFRGASPGRHIHPGHLSTRLSKLFSTRAARQGTLYELTKLAPGPSPPKPSATPPRPSDATPPTQQRPTLTTSQPLFRPGRSAPASGTTPIWPTAITRTSWASPPLWVLIDNGSGQSDTCVASCWKLVGNDLLSFDQTMGENHAADSGEQQHATAH